MLRSTSMVACAFLVCACSFGPTAEIIKIRSLGEPILATESHDDNGRIDGLERASVDQAGKLQANVLIVHGMGWSQQAVPEDRFGFDFVDAVDATYRVRSSTAGITRLCPQYGKDGRQDRRYPPGGLKIVAEPGTPALQTDAPGTLLYIDQLACMDRIVLDLGPKGKINVYRLFWDDTFYSAYEYRLLGYDDGLFLGHELSDARHRGYENIDGLRSNMNRRLKTDLVTYGFSDATMYLGVAGQQIREALRGGLCAAINEASGQTRLFEEFQAAHAASPHDEQFIGQRASAKTLCQAGSPLRPAPLIVITKSLGSRAMFDVLTSDLRPELAAKLQQISNENLEVFMFANQIPLLGVGKLTPAVDARRTASTKNTRFIAVSEINDLLTYELVPYFEHLYYVRCSAGQPCDTEHFRQRMSDFRSSAPARNAYIRELGFDVIDVRARFAGRLIPFVSLMDPLLAHDGHLKAEPVRHLFFCGADGGKPRISGCNAR